MKAKAKAHTNIALIKYWGKRDETLILPMNSSLSLTLDRFYTVTQVEFAENQTEDVFYLNGKQASGDETLKVSRFLDHIRKKAGKHFHATVRSENHVPTAAGFASSASGYAALAAASAKAAGLDLSLTELSRLARLGSGSACRSVFGGYVEWKKGEKEDGSDSHAVPLLDGGKFPVSVLAVMVEGKRKKVLSREGMKRTVYSSPFYRGWLETVDEDLRLMKQALEKRDFTLLGETAERNALKMHATTLGAVPPFYYWQSGTIAIMDMVRDMRRQNIETYFTIDAGPNVKVLCRREDEEKIAGMLKENSFVKDVILCRHGPGIAYLNDVE